MPIAAVIKSALLVLVLINPFLLSVYLMGMMRQLSLATFTRVMFHAVVISGVVFCLFALIGDRLFTDVLQVRFAAFLIFGGIVFLIIGIRFVFQGPEAVELLRGEPEHLAGSVAMPFLIGPGTINASILAGSRVGPGNAALAIAAALLGTLVIVVAFKVAHDFVGVRNKRLIDRYVDLCGRISALVIGTISIEMIFQGVEAWLTQSPLTQ